MSAQPNGFPTAGDWRKRKAQAPPTRSVSEGFTPKGSKVKKLILWPFRCFGMVHQRYAGGETSTAVSYGGKPSSELLAAGGFLDLGNWRKRKAQAPPTRSVSEGIPEG